MICDVRDYPPFQEFNITIMQIFIFKENTVPNKLRKLYN